jgi:hypothetical protein
MEQVVTRGPKKQWFENINLPLPDGGKARIDAVLDKEAGETRLDLIRNAIDTEVERREQLSARKKPFSRKPQRD